MRVPHRYGEGVWWWRSAVRFLLVSLLASAALALGVVTGPTPAYADGLDDLCQTVPAPVRPDFQVAGLVMDKPGHGNDLSSVPDVAPDPFKDPKVPIADVYGFAWRYTNYDLGCGNDFIRDPNAVVSTNAANVAMAGTATMTSTIASMENMAHASVFGWLVPVVVTIADALKGRVLTIWLPLALIVLSVVVGATALRAGYAESFRRLQVVLVSIVLAVISLVFPAKAADLMDQAATTVADAAQIGFPNRASDVITRETVYKTWLVGNFGSADSQTATHYGPRLMSALTYTWSDIKRMQADPAAKTAIDKAKGAEFKKIADEVKLQDPAAYESLTGKSDTRTAATILGLVFVLIMGFFVTVAALITVVARLVMIALVVAAMLGSVIGVVHFGALQRMWDLFTAAVINTAKFTIAAGVMTLVLAAIAGSPVGTGWRLLLAVVVTVIAIMITKPVASFKAMSGMNVNGHLLSGLLRRATGTAMGVVMGQKASELDPTPRQPPIAAEDTSAADSTTWTQPVEPAMSPLPAATSARALPVSSRQQTAPPAWVGAETFGETGRGRELPIEPTQAAPRDPLALPAQAPAVNTGDVHTTPVGLENYLRAAPASAVPQPSDSSRGVVYPTGIVVQAEPGLYRPGQGSARNDEEVYLKSPEAQVDANGEETWSPRYHSPVSV